jgi:long-subunit acyl-CoA synthetase (AMP-forming)
VTSPLPPDVADFFAGLGMKILDVYGMTETTGAFTGQALAYGDRRPYMVALLTLDGEAAPAWARARGIPAGSLEALASDPRVQAEMAAAVAAANERPSGRVWAARRGLPRPRPEPARR